ncbi:MAG: ceramidase domain-containing protein [Xanthobacteraceae bacterium]|nr:ceramidase domain-containing protein [Xanthobacteraceae bacterium]
MDWSQPLDLYCERTDATFWSEPANAVSNAAFLIAAAAAFVHWRRSDRGDWPALALICVVAVVGIGSFTFHTVATRGAVLADVIPIAIFIYGYLLLALRRFLRLPCIAAGAIVVAYAAAAQGLSALAPPRFLNGSVGYLPALVALIVVAAAAKEEDVRRTLFVVALVFAISLTLRTVDIALCPTFPLGTHFAWHILNAMVLYILLRIAMAARLSRVG